MQNLKSYSKLLLFLILAACNSPEAPVEDEPVTPEPEAKSGTVNFEGVTYPTLQWEAGPVWLAQNLSVEVADSWCYENSADCPELGRLYRWDAAQTACANLGPDWRVPTVAEWEQLAMRFGGFQDWLSVDPTGDPVAANKALQAGGQSGLNLILSGRRGSNGGFEGKGETGFYWSATPGDDGQALCFQIQKPGAKLNRRAATKRMGFLCRCVK
ncbi:MAG: hypothetical protein KDC34_02800 [Saprospiraceae bacterium]|nr:hypothetical protein [Saprospiraceae bacterium]